MAPTRPSNFRLQAARDEICVTSQYTCDNIQTYQEWFFQPQDCDDLLTYNCQQTIQNCGSVDLVEYAQFFACYTETNREKSQFYWSKDRQFKSFESVGGKHLEAYIVAPGSPFERLGLIPHALRGGGKVADTWYQPVLVGQPSPKGWRHIVFTEPAATAGLASGMGGIAMDYIAYPGAGVFKRGESFQFASGIISLKCLIPFRSISLRNSGRCLRRILSTKVGYV